MISFFGYMVDENKGMFIFSNDHLLRLSARQIGCREKSHRCEHSCRQEMRSLMLVVDWVCSHRCGWRFCRCVVGNCSKCLLSHCRRSVLDKSNRLPMIDNQNDINSSFWSSSKIRLKSGIVIMIVIFCFDFLEIKNETIFVRVRTKSYPHIYSIKLYSFLDHASDGKSSRLSA